ncbi:MAG: hypothetical protein WAN12_04695 [Candidatus Acidiferrum sp.]
MMVTTSRRGVIQFLTGAVLTAALTTQASANDKTYSHCCKSVLSSSGEAKLGEVDFSILSTMSAGDFFQGLEYIRRDSAGLSSDEFRKDGRIVSQFPEELEIVIAFVTLAGVRNKPSHFPSISEVEELSRSLEFDASWKTGVESHPAELIAPPEMAKKPSPGKKEGIIGWSNTFHVRARNVPLTDHLVISVFGPGKKFLGRVTFDLISDLTWHPGPTK